MKAVTTGPGISGTVADYLELLMCDFRIESGDERWHLHIQVSRTHEYSLRVYAPDRHTELYTVVMTSSTGKEIRDILVREAEWWQARVRAAVAIAMDEGAASTI
jgi:hypothetical protein